VGYQVDPADLTESGEDCMRRLVELERLHMPPAPLITAIGTVVEVHVSRALTQLVRASRIESSAFGAALLNELEPTMTRTWRDRGHWLKLGFSVEYRGNKPYQDFEVLVDLRNTIVHGDGQLSDLQARSAIKDLVKMRAQFADRLEVALNERARFSPSTSTKALLIARAFVQDFDRQLLSKYPFMWRL
jgi:hypothetical protein